MSFEALTTLLQKPFDLLIHIVAFLVALVLHELSHAVIARACGDPTAQQAGRITLNPLVHLDPFGSVILPLLSMMLGGGMIAYAKPVPYNPANLKQRTRDEVLVALAGPLSNLLQALVGALLLGLVLGSVSIDFVQSAPWMAYVFKFLTIYIMINISLMFFNLLPIPPLDGSAIIFPLLSKSAQQRYYQIQAQALPILLVLLYILPQLTHVDILGMYIGQVGGALFDMLYNFASFIQAIFVRPLL